MTHKDREKPHDEFSLPISWLQQLLAFRLILFHLFRLALKCFHVFFAEMFLHKPRLTYFCPVTLLCFTNIDALKINRNTILT